MSVNLANDADLIRSLLSHEASPPGDGWELFLGYAVLMRAKGLQSTAADVHDTWAAWMLGRNAQHPSIVPFDQLSAEVQAMDLPYLHAIHAAARHRIGHPPSTPL